MSCILPPHLAHLDMRDARNRLRGAGVICYAKGVAPPRVRPEKVAHYAISAARRAHPGETLSPCRGRRWLTSIVDRDGLVALWYDTERDKSTRLHVIEKRSIRG
jgi:hypothetical protein